MLMMNNLTTNPPFFNIFIKRIIYFSSLFMHSFATLLSIHPTWLNKKTSDPVENRNRSKVFNLISKHLIWWVEKSVKIQTSGGIFCQSGQNIFTAPFENVFHTTWIPTDFQQVASGVLKSKHKITDGDHPISYILKNYSLMERKKTKNHLWKCADPFATVLLIGWLIALYESPSWQLNFAQRKVRSNCKLLNLSSFLLR